MNPVLKGGVAYFFLRTVILDFCSTPSYVAMGDPVLDSISSFKSSITNQEQHLGTSWK